MSSSPSLRTVTKLHCEWCWIGGGNFSPLFLTLSFIVKNVITAVTWWAKPETDLYVWAQEELRERRILRRIAAYAIHSLNALFLCLSASDLSSLSQETKSV